MARKASNGPRRGRGTPAEVGVVARLVDRAFDDPAMSGGLFVLTLTIMAIVSNALFLQPASHPKPFFPTRAIAAAPAPAVRETASGSVATPIPLPRERDKAALAELAGAAAAPEPVTAPESTHSIAATGPAPGAQAARSAPDQAAERIVSIQRELARLGLYSGAIDGIVGSRTRAAISRYEAAAGIRATGEPSADLLRMLTAPTPPADVGSDAAASPPPLDVAAIERETAEAAEADRYRRVQGALNKIGYGPLNADGTAGPETTNAIRRFELDNGLTISGTPSDEVMSRLVAIGALDSA